MQLKQAARTRLFLARHGQTAQSRDDVFCGVTEVPLTEKGREEAQLLAQRLRHRVDRCALLQPRRSGTGDRDTYKSRAWLTAANTRSFTRNEFWSVGGSLTC